MCKKSCPIISQLSVQIGTFLGDPWENLIVSLHGRMKIDILKNGGMRQHFYALLSYLQQKKKKVLSLLQSEILPTAFKALR
jgi:hypothetical protein